LLVQVVGWRTQPTTGVGLGMKAGGHEHWARWFTTWHAALGPQASPTQGSTHLDREKEKAVEILLQNYYRMFTFVCMIVEKKKRKIPIFPNY
jgi:hypothetical protein